MNTVMAWWCRAVHLRPDPLEVWIPVGFSIAGLSQLIFDAIPGSVDELFPEFVQYLWAVVLSLGGLLMLLGVYGPPTYRWFQLKSIGLLCLSLGTLAYAAALVLYNFPGSLLASITYAMFAIAFWRKRGRVEKALSGERAAAAQED